MVSASSFPIRTVEEITAGFPVEKIPPVVGKPNLPELMRVHEIIRQCAMTIRETGGPFGMLYLVEPANVYAALTNIPYYPPPLPADQPQTTPVMLPAEVTRVTTEWYIARQRYYNHKNANQALIAFFRKAFDADILTEIASDMAANTETEFIRVFERFLAKYGQPDSQDEEKNNVRMKQPWDPAHEDFTKLVRQIEDGARFAGYVNNPFSDTQLVKIAEKIILDTKMLKAEYKDWMRIAPAARHWNAFKEFWADAHTTWLTTEKASGDFGYGESAAGICNSKNTAVSREAECRQRNATRSYTEYR